MKKRDFIQQATIQFMPKTEWNIDKSIQYAEKLWLKLEQKGYGDTPESKPKTMVNYYKQLSAKSAKQFDQFWTAFDNKQGRQRAAMRWGQMGEQSTDELKKIIQAAKQTAAARKNLSPEQTPIMAEGWLSQMRFDDAEETHTEKTSKAQNQAILKIREVTGKLNHAKKMASTSNDAFWEKDVEKLTEQLKQLRHSND